MINHFGEDFIRHHRLPAQVLKTLRAIQQCRTAALGGHIDACDKCGHIRISFNSCRNRHCPKCQVVPREKWIIARKADLLPVRYFHVVFTLPQELNKLSLHSPKQVYNILFSSAWETMQAFASDHKHLGAKTGMVAILHTWGQNLSIHPHLHCIVPGGGITEQAKWRPARNNAKFLFPVKAMSQVFRAKFVAHMRAWAQEKTIIIPQSFYDKLFKRKWIVYAKQPFYGPEAVVEYLGRYTHKIAISNHRLVNVSKTGVSFTWKDYRDGSRKKVMKLNGVEFLRRFAQHILPHGFVRIRHYGILSSRAKKENLEIARTALNAEPITAPQTSDWKIIAINFLNYNPDKCPCCGKGQMITLMHFDGKRGPPDLKQLLKWKSSVVN